VRTSVLAGTAAEDDGANRRNATAARATTGRMRSLLRGVNAYSLGGRTPNEDCTPVAAMH
jgi:hypothetical protein